MLFVWILIKFWWIWSVKQCFEFSINLIDFWLSVKIHMFDKSCIKLVAHSVVFSIAYILASVMFIPTFKFHDFDKIWKFWYSTTDAAEIFDFSSCLHQYKTQLCFFDSKFILSVENNFFELYSFWLSWFTYQLIEINFAMKRLYDWNFQSDHNQNQRWFLILIAIFWSVELTVFRIDFSSKIDFFQL